MPPPGQRQHAYRGAIRGQNPDTLSDTSGVALGRCDILHLLLRRLCSYWVNMLISVHDANGAEHGLLPAHCRLLSCRVPEILRVNDRILAPELNTPKDYEPCVARLSPMHCTSLADWVRFSGNWCVPEPSPAISGLRLLRTQAQILRLWRAANRDDSSHRRPLGLLEAAPEADSFRLHKGTTSIQTAVRLCTTAKHRQSQAGETSRLHGTGFQLLMNEHFASPA